MARRKLSKRKASAQRGTHASGASDSTRTAQLAVNGTLGESGGKRKGRRLKLTPREQRVPAINRDDLARLPTDATLRVVKHTPTHVRVDMATYRRGE